MKVVHITTYLGGGAGIAAQRLVEAECGLGLDSILLTAVNSHGDRKSVRCEEVYKGVIGRYTFRLCRRIESLASNIANKPRRIMASLGLPNPLAMILILRKIREMNPDIVHLHWINDGFFPIETFAFLKKPVVWTCHDRWPEILVHHHDPNDIPGKDDNDSKVGLLTYMAGLLTRLMRKVQDLRFRLSSRDISIVFVAPSKWMYEHVSQKYSDRIVRHIPNACPVRFKGIDTSRHLINRSGRPSEAINILFVVASPLKDQNKNLSVIDSVICKVRSVLGDGRISFKLACKQVLKEQAKASLSSGSLRVTSIIDGWKDETEFCRILEDIDILVIPSHCENLPNIGIEAISAGVLTLVCGSCGQKDLVPDIETPLYSEKCDAGSIAKSIIDVCRLLVEESHRSRIELIQLNQQKLKTQWAYGYVGALHIQAYRELNRL